MLIQRRIQTGSRWQNISESLAEVSGWQPDKPRRSMLQPFASALDITYCLSGKALQPLWDYTVSNLNVMQTEQIYEPITP